MLADCAYAHYRQVGNEALPLLMRHDLEGRERLQQFQSLTSWKSSRTFRCTNKAKGQLRSFTHGGAETKKQLVGKAIQVRESRTPFTQTVETGSLMFSGNNWCEFGIKTRYLKPMYSILLHETPDELDLSSGLDELTRICPSSCS